MKVVLFCGGLGQRLRDYSENVPKPMVPIGYRPILWHVMRYYAHYGHRDFVLCLGYRADLIKSYFRNYDECLSNDFVMSGGGQGIQLLSSDIQDWRIAFCDTGLHSNIGMRLKAVEKHVSDEDVFLANYSDGVCDLPLPEYIDFFMKSGKTAAFICVRPKQSFHAVDVTQDGIVTKIRDLSQSGTEINGGYFIFRKKIFDYIRAGEELVHEPFERLIAQRELIAYHYAGFWACMDTFKDKKMLDDLQDSGNPPWCIWSRQPQG